MCLIHFLYIYHLPFGLAAAKEGSSAVRAFFFGDLSVGDTALTVRRFLLLTAAFFAVGI